MKDEQIAATSDLDKAFEVLEQAERFVAKVEGPEDYALAPAIATARSEFRLLREAFVAVSDAAYVLKHESKARPLHDALYHTEELYEQAVTKTAISPITKKEPRDVGAPGATT